MSQGEVHLAYAWPVLLDVRLLERIGRRGGSRLEGGNGPGISKHGCSWLTKEEHGVEMGSSCSLGGEE